MERCAYCGKKRPCPLKAPGPSGGEVRCCGEECRGKLRAFAARARRGRPLLYLGLTLCILLLLAGLGVQSVLGSATVQQILMGLSFFVLGASMLAFPFVPPDWVEWLGVRRTVLVVRMVGALLAALGAAVLLIRLFALVS